jgi:hypothetical protein
VTDADPPIRIVLDTTAVLTWIDPNPDRAILIGEPIAELADEGARFAVPVVCLAEAHARAGDTKAIERIVAHRHGVVTPIIAGDWPALSAARIVLDRLDLAAAFMTADGPDAHIVTAEPEKYAAVADEISIIEV